MNGLNVFCATALAAGLALSAAIPGLADDSAASIAAGGLVPRRETRIVMAKEVLQISPTKVVVDYDFRNDSDQDVNTEVAFPVPPYSFDLLGPDVKEQSFSDFQIVVDGRAVQFKTEIKAILNGQDVTDTLTEYKIDIRDFAHPDWRSVDENGAFPFLDFSRLPKKDQEQLEAWGLFDRELEGFLEPRWEVHVQYHWRQTFPAHSVVHIRHEYSPVVGYRNIARSPELLALATKEPYVRGSAKLDAGERDDLDLLTSFCPTEPLLLEMESVEVLWDGRIVVADGPSWVDFILTSANTWQRPIKDFILIVERGKPGSEHEERRISFCSPQNANVEKLDADHFQVHLTNFVPTSELHIGFFDVPAARPAQPSVRK